MANHAHSTRTPLFRPADAPPPLLPVGLGSKPAPVALALRAMRTAYALLTIVPAQNDAGPVTTAIRTMRAADPAFELSPELRALRRALADRIEADIAALDALGGDDELEAEHDGREPSEDDEPCLGSLGGTGGSYGLAGFGLRAETWSGGSLDDREEENEHGTEIDDGEAGDDNGIVDMGGVQEQGFRGYSGVL